MIKQPPAAPAAGLSGVPRIIDTDTLEVAGQKVRLQGIDAPESAQTCRLTGGRRYQRGKQATEALRTRLGQGAVARHSPPYLAKTPPGHAARAWSGLPRPAEPSPGPRRPRLRGAVLVTAMPHNIRRRWSEITRPLPFVGWRSSRLRQSGNLFSGHPPQNPPSLRTGPLTVCYPHKRSMGPPWVSGCYPPDADELAAWLVKVLRVTEQSSRLAYDLRPGQVAARPSPSTFRPERPERKSVRPIVPPGGLQVQAPPARRRRVLLLRGLWQTAHKRCYE